MVVGLILLVIVTFLALSMFRGLNLQERIAGSTRDKQRAYEAAQSALQYAEWWLSQTPGPTVVAACATGVINGNVSANVVVCATPPTNINTLPWPYRITYTPPNMMMVAGGGGMAAGGDINYVDVPGFYITQLGPGPTSGSQLYQISAYGFGGNADTFAVVQSTFEIATGVRDLSGG